MFFPRFPGSPFPRLLFPLLALLLAVPALAQSSTPTSAAVRITILYGNAADVVSSVNHAGVGETGRPLLALNERTRDPWLGSDKLLHVSFSFLLTLSSQYTLVNKLGLSERQALPVSATSTAAVGLAKELYDAEQPNNYFSHRDLAADALGIGLAVLLIAL